MAATSVPSPAVRRSGSPRLLLIGAGPHARRTYIPHLEELRQEYAAELAAVVDLEASRDLVQAWLQGRGLAPRTLWAAPFQGESLPPALGARLDRLVAEEEIAGVVLSTPPETHKAYALWALARGLSVLMDKPISTRPGAACDPEQALGIWRDYQELARSYRRLQPHRRTAFLVNAHRRYHPTYQTVAELIREVRDATGCPLTSAHSSHCDGQWRLPDEIVDLDYHGYNQGFGKASHSGYHFFDTALWFYRESLLPGKEAETAEISATFVHPRALLHHLQEADYQRLFPGYRQARRYRQEDLPGLYEGFGEVDVYGNVALLARGETVGHLSFHLLHNSFSQRGWLSPNLGDLYKGNGRVRHEFHTLQQGPFQNLQIHSFQSKARQDEEAPDAHGIGGANHWDIHVFRNQAILGPPRYRKISVDDLIASSPDRLVVEEIKKGGLIELLRFLHGRIGRSELRSNIDSHDLAPALMSGLYLSHIRKSRGETPCVPFCLRDRCFLSASPAAGARPVAVPGFPAV